MCLTQCGVLSLPSLLLHLPARFPRCQRGLVSILFRFVDVCVRSQLRQCCRGFPWWLFVLIVFVGGRLLSHWLDCPSICGQLGVRHDSSVVWLLDVWLWVLLCIHWTVSRFRDIDGLLRSSMSYTPLHRFYSLCPNRLCRLLLLCYLDVFGFCHAGLSRRFLLFRFSFWQLVSTMGDECMARLSRSFRTCVGIVAVYFRGLIGVRCRRFLFVRRSLAISGIVI